MRRKFDAAGILLSGVISGLTLFWTYTILLSRTFADESDNLAMGKFMSGEHIFPYTNIFSHHMPGPYYVAAILYPLFGTHAGFYRLLMVALLYVNALLIYLILGQLEIKSIWKKALFASTYPALAITFWGHMFLADNFVTVLSGLSLYFFLMGRRLSNNWFYAAAGAAIGLSFIFRLTAVYILAVLGAELLLRKKWRSLFVTGAGAAAPVAAFLLVNFIAGDLGAFLKNAIIFNFTTYSHRGSGTIIDKIFPHLNLWHYADVKITYFFLAVSVLYFAVAVWRRQRNVILVACLTIIGFLMTYPPSYGYFHCGTMLFFGAILLALPVGFKKKFDS